MLKMEPILDLQKLSQKIQLIFNTLQSIANNLEESSLEDLLLKLSSIVMSQINSLLAQHEDHIEKVNSLFEK